MDDSKEAAQKPEERVRDEFAPGDAEDRAEEAAAAKPQDRDIQEEPHKDDEALKKPSTTEEDVLPGQADGKSSTAKEPTPPAPIQTFISDEPSEPKAQHVPATATITASTSMPPPPSPSLHSGPSNEISASDSSFTSPRGHSAGRTYSRGGLGRGFTRIPNGETPRATPPNVAEKPPAPLPEPKGLGVIGAPTAPKALRQGLPNVGIKQDAGFSIVGRASASRVNGEARVKRYDFAIF